MRIRPSDLGQTILPPRLSPETGFIEDAHPPIELEMMEALQDFLMVAYDKKGLILEALPTSNVYIARLKNYMEHPIFRWTAPQSNWLEDGARFNRFGLRRGALRVCVSTDDPAYMPTTLRTEFALLREAAVALGVGRTDAEKWVEKLRLFGLQEFARKHRPVWIKK
ncbi:MAG: hypothetical protein HYZ45_05460 [Burkholderiales bacterium]|nr:hypothetical protein [Burkholderiales bacterium]